MDRRLAILIFSAIIIIVTCIVTLTVVRHQRTSSSIYLLNIFDKYFDTNNIALYVRNGKTMIKITVKLNKRTVKDIQTVLLNNITIGHILLRSGQMYFIYGSHMLLIYKSSMVAQTIAEYKNFTYIFYTDYSTERSYECYKGIIKISEGYKTYRLSIGGVCLVYNSTVTPFKLSKIYYKCISNILRKIYCRKISSIICSFNGSINYAEILYKEVKTLNKIRMHELGANRVYEIIRNRKGVCYVNVRAVLSTYSLMSTESILCPLKNVKFSVVALSRYIGLKFMHGRYSKLLRQITSFKKVKPNVNPAGNVSFTLMMYGIECIRNVPEPFALVQVLNMPAELLLMSIILHVY